MKLKDQAISGVKWTALENVISLIVSLASISILAKFLAPGDFGLMALATVVIGFSQAFVDMGFSNAILYKQNLTRVQLSTLYWLNLIAGAVVFSLIALGSGLIATFYSEPRLQDIMTLTGTIFLILPFGQQFAVLMRKELQFHLLSKIGISGRIVTLLVAIFLACDDYGVYSLVVSSLVGAVFTTFFMVVFGLGLHRPALTLKVSEVREFFSFGAYQMMEKIANYFNSNVDSLIVGRMLGVNELGIYSVAKQLTMRPAQMINPVITRVSLPLMAKVQDDICELKNIYLSSINYLCSVNFPIYFMVIFFAKDITLLMLGVKWLDAVPTIQLLAAYCGLRSVGNPVGALLLARGRARLAFIWNMALLAVLPLVMLLGSAWGLHGIALSLVITAFVLMLPTWLYLVRPLCGATFIEYHRLILRSALIAAIGVSGAFYLLVMIEAPWARVLTGTAVCSIFLLLLNYVFNRQFISALLQFARKKKPSQLKTVD